MSSRIDNLRLVASLTNVYDKDIIDFDISFKVNGRIRDIFNADTWRNAYDKHDNLFRIKYTISLSDVMKQITLIRKASFYWSRDPYLYPPPPSKKIWAMIIIDEHPIIPSSIEHARSLLFDVNNTISVSGSVFNKEHKVYAEVKASWGKHTFITEEEISARSDAITIRKV